MLNPNVLKSMYIVDTFDNKLKVSIDDILCVIFVRF